MCVCAPACPDVTEQRQQQQEGCISTNYFFFIFVEVLLFFFNGKDKIPVCFSSEQPIHFSFQFLSFCVIITFATVKQARKNKGNSLDSA